MNVVDRRQVLGPCGHECSAIPDERGSITVPTECPICGVAVSRTTIVHAAPRRRRLVLPAGMRILIVLFAAVAYSIGGGVLCARVGAEHGAWALALCAALIAVGFPALWWSLDWTADATPHDPDPATVARAIRAVTRQDAQ